MTVRSIAMPTPRSDDVYFFAFDMSDAVKTSTNKTGVITGGEGVYIRATLELSDSELDALCVGMGRRVVTGDMLNNVWPSWVGENPSAKVKFKPLITYRDWGGPKDVYIAQTTTRAQLYDWMKTRYTLIRPGLKNISPEWLSRLAANAMNRVTGRTLDYRPPYFSFTANMVRNDYSYDDAAKPFAPKAVAVSTGWLFDGTEIDAIDPWAKMFKGIEHQVFHYGEGDTVQPNASGQYAWPFGLTMPIVPTVGNIYVHFLQMYLSRLANDIGAVGLSSPAWSGVDTNVTFATVYPESVNSAQVACGNFVLYAGHGITYGHPEGAYIARLMMPDATLSDAQVLALSRDVAAYANRRRVAWISQNQAIHAKAQQIVTSGANLYALNVSELTNATIVVTDAGGVVVSTGGTTQITGGSGQGAIVTQPPTTDQALDVADVTPSNPDPLQIGTVKITSGATSVPAGSGGSALAPLVSIARDTSPALVSAQRAYANAKASGATDAQALSVASGAVTTPEKKSSFIPITAALALLSFLN